MERRGHYGKMIVGQVPPPAATVYVERQSSSIGKWIFGTIVVGGAVLWARHQSQQIVQLQKSAGLPPQSFAASLRQSAGSSLRGLAKRVRPEAAKVPKTPKASKVIESKGEGR